MSCTLLRGHADRGQEEPILLVEFNGCRLQGGTPRSRNRLSQSGSKAGFAKVTGQMKVLSGRSSSGISPEGIQIEGTVSGDTFTFHEMTGPTTRGEFQVNGDEMIGGCSRLATQTATLRRRQ